MIVELILSGCSIHVPLSQFSPISSGMNYGGGLDVWGQGRGGGDGPGRGDSQRRGSGGESATGAGFLSVRGSYGYGWGALCRRDRNHDFEILTEHRNLFFWDQGVEEA